MCFLGISMYFCSSTMFNFQQLYTIPKYPGFFWVNEMNNLIFLH